MKLTKEIVDRLLKANVKNRGASRHRVEAISRAMKNGWFEPNNGQTIVVNESWTWLLDGQHRLLAMRDSGVYGFVIPLVEVKDEDAEKIFNTIDIVRGARTSAQVISIGGRINNAVAVCSLINRMLFHVANRQSASPEEIEHYYKKFEPLISRMVITRRTVGGIVANSHILAGVLNAALISDDSNAVIDRFGRIMENNCTCVCDNLILNIIISSHGKDGRYSRDAFYKVTKGLLNPDLKTIKIARGEDLECLRNKVFID